MVRRILFWALMAALALVPAAVAADEMTATFLDAGKADCILLRTEAAAVLVDAGTEAFGEGLPDILREMGVQAIDLLIVTHFDKDHVGGADHVLENFPVLRVVEPEYEENSKQVDQYWAAAKAAGVRCEVLKENLSLEIGGMALEIDVPDILYDQDNDNSLVTMVRFGDAHLLLAADAESARLRELLDMDLACDVLKVPHHGVYESWSPEFFAACGAKYAVITASDEDPEEAETLLALELAGTEALFTRKGAVTAVFDASGVRLEQRQGEN